MPSVLINLLLTILVELPILMIGLRKRPPLQVAWVCVLVNGFTLPLATLIYISLGINYWVMEGGVMVVEALLLAWIWDVRILRTSIISLVANFASIGLGVLLKSAEWW